MSEQEVSLNRETNPLAIVGLILGIISVILTLVSCCTIPLISSILSVVLGIAAIILGLIAKKQVKERGESNSQLKMANAAFILGIIGTVLGFIALAIAIITSLVLKGPAIEQLFQDALDQLDFQK